MKSVEKWLWKIRWAGRTTTTRVHFTEDEVRAQHPEAERIEASRISVELPETGDELTAARQPRGHR